MSDWRPGKSARRLVRRRLRRHPEAATGPAVRGVGEGQEPGVRAALIGCGEPPQRKGRLIRPPSERCCG